MSVCLSALIVCKREDMPKMRFMFGQDKAVRIQINRLSDWTKVTRMLHSKIDRHLRTSAF